MSIRQLFNDGKVNWNTKQPMSFDTVEAYIAVAKRLQSQHDKFIKTLQEQTGVELEIVPTCIKDGESAQRKLGDHTVNSDPRNINDYLRSSGDMLADNKADTIKQTQALIKFAQESEQVTGYKDQVSFPDAETGMRSIKLHVRVQEGGDAMDAEFLIGHKGMGAAYEATKIFRNLERDFRKASCTGDDVLNKKAIEKCCRDIPIVRGLRHIIHNEAAETIGWNDLIDERVKHLHQSVLSDITIHKNMFGKKSILNAISSFGSPS